MYHKTLLGGLLALALPVGAEAQPDKFGGLREFPQDTRRDLLFRDDKLGQPLKSMEYRLLPDDRPTDVAARAPAANDTDAKMKELQQALDEAILAYQKELAQIEKDAKAGAEDIEKKAPKNPSAAEAVVGHTVKFENVEHVLKVPTPVVKMVQRDVSAHIPQVVGTAKQEIIFHTPSVRMVPKVVGRYPEVNLGRVKWKDIVTDVPETFQQEQRVTVHIPQVKMERHDWKVNVPEFSVTHRELKFNLPSVTVKSIKKEGEKAEEQGEDLSKEVQERTKKAAEGFAKAKAEKVKKPHAALFEAIRAQIRAEKEKAIGELKAAEEAVEAGLKQMRDAKVPDSDAAYKELASQKEKFGAARKEMEAAFDKALAEVATAEKESLSKILEGK